MLILTLCRFFTRSAQTSNDSLIGSVSEGLQRQNRVLEHKMDLLRRKLNSADTENVSLQTFPNTSFEYLTTNSFVTPLIQLRLWLG